MIHDWDMIKATMTTEDLCEIGEFAMLAGISEKMINSMLKYPERYKIDCPTPVFVSDRRKIFLRRECLDFAKYYRDHYDRKSIRSRKVKKNE